MKLKAFFIPGILVVFVLCGCLKDTPYLDVSNTAPVIQFGLSPASGNTGPFSFAGDTAASPVIDTAIALVIASPQVLSKTVTVRVQIDQSQISSYNSANGTNYTLLPQNLYTLHDSAISILAGHRVGRIPVSLNLPMFPATHSYALPLVIADGGGLLISGNSAQFMWLFQR